MNFIVTVACAIGISCPLPRPMVSPFVATSTRECEIKVRHLIAYYKYDPTKFVISCERK